MLVLGLEAASIQARSFSDFVRAAGSRACQRDFVDNEVRQFIGQCENALRKQIPLAGDPTQEDCGFNNQQFSAPSAHKEACTRALQPNMSRIITAGCNTAFMERSAPTTLPTQSAGAIAARAQSPVPMTLPPRSPGAIAALAQLPQRPLVPSESTQNLHRPVQSIPNITPAMTPTALRVCADGRSVPVNMPCQMATATPVRTKTCPNGITVPVTQDCPMAQAPKEVGAKCPDGTIVRGAMRCPVAKLKARTCPAGYRVLDNPNKYGAFCEQIPVADKPRPIMNSTSPTPPKTAAQKCRTERVCVAWGKGQPGALAGPCTNYKQQTVCGGGPAVR